MRALRLGETNLTMVADVCPAQTGGRVCVVMVTSDCNIQLLMHLMANLLIGEDVNYVGSGSQSRELHNRDKRG